MVKERRFGKINLYLLVISNMERRKGRENLDGAMALTIKAIFMKI